MGVELATAYVSLVPSMRGTSKIVASELATANPVAESAGRQMGEKMTGGFRGVVGKMGSILKTGALAGGAVMGAAGAVGIKTAAQMETANIAFTTMLGSADKAKSFLGDLSKFAAKTPFDLPGLQTSAQSLISIGIDSSKVIPIMTTLGNVTSGMGTGAEGIQRATVAIQQMNAAGRISAEDLNQLRDAGIPVFDLLTAATGKTTAEIAEMAGKGKLGREEMEQLMAALESGKGLERFNGMMEAQSQSMSGLWSTLQDTFSVGMADAITPLIPLIKGGLGGAIALTESLMPKLKFGLTELVGGIRSFGAAWAANDGDVTSSGFPGFMERTAYALRQVWDAIGPEMVGGIRAFGAAWEANNGDVTSDGFPGFMERVANALRSVQSWFGKLDFSSYEGFMSSLGTAGGEVGTAFGSIGESVKTLMPAFKEFGDQLPNLGAALPELAAGGLKMVTGALGFLADNVDTIIAWMPALVGLFIAWRVAMMGVAVAHAVAVPLQVAANITRFAAARAELQLAIASRGSAAATAQATAAEKVGLITRLRNTAATVASRVAALASAAAMRVMAGAQRVLNLVMKANPIGIVVTALMALVAGAVWAYHNIGWFKDGVNAAWAGIQAAAGAVGRWFTEWLWPKIDFAIKMVGAVFRFLWTKAVEIWSGIVKSITDKINFIRAWITRIVTIIQVYWALAWGLIRAKAKEIWTGITTTISGAIDWVRTWIETKIGNIRRNWELVWGFIRDKATEIWTGIKTSIANVWNLGIKPIWDTIMRVIKEDVPNAFRKGVDFIKEIWNGIKSIAKKPISFIINTVLNDGLIGAYNKVADFLKIGKIDPIKIPGFARGGILDGYESRKRDTVLTPMRPGEGVLVPEVVRGIGAATVHALNAAGNRGGVAAVRAMMHPGRAKGGLIHPVPSGIISSGYRTAARPDHDGIDYAAPTGTPIRAAAAGSVLAAGWGSGGAGNMVQLQHMGGLTTLYYHMSRVLARIGQAVTAGSTIGAVGSTGNSTGPHLHFTTRINGRDVNPAGLLSGKVQPDGGGGGWGFLNPFDALLKWAKDQFSKAFPEAGKFVDMAIGAGSKLIEGGMDWAKNALAGALDFLNPFNKPNRKAKTAGPLPPQPGESPWLFGFHDHVRKAGAARYTPLNDGTEPWDVPGAAAAWDDKSAIDVAAGRGAYQGYVRRGPIGRFTFGPSTLAHAYEGAIGFNPANMAHSPAYLRATAMHEIGHTLGLPHTSRPSIMQPSIQNHMQPTAFDIQNLNRLYPGMARGGVVPQLFDSGGWLESRAEPQLVANHTGRRERILDPQESDVWESLESGELGRGDTFNLYGVPMDQTQEVVHSIMFEKKRRRRGGVHNGQ
jgi:tape measure domain-containing protein